MKNMRLTRDRIAARLLGAALDLAARLHCKDLFQGCLFLFLPLRWTTYLTVSFMRHSRRRDLDHHFQFFCGPRLEKNIDWLRSQFVARGYANEIWYYLYIFGYYQSALHIFGRLDWERADELLLTKASEFAQTTASGYSMNLLPLLHTVGWHSVRKEALGEFAKLIRAMMDSRFFEFEEGIFRSRAAHLTDLARAPIDQYIPHFFRNKNLIQVLQSELGLSQHPEIISELDRAGPYWEPFPNENASEAADIACYYAYRNLLSRTYNNGEGQQVEALAEAAAQTQDRIRRRMPAASGPLRSELERTGIFDLKDLRLLSPDWGAVIGHSAHLNVHLMMRDLGWWSGSPLLLTYADKIANRAFLSLMEDRCPTWILEENASFAVWHELASLSPFVGAPQTFRLPEGRSLNWNDAGAMAVAEWERQGRGFPLRESYDKRARGDAVSSQFDQLRRQWGMTSGDWYACLHMRDAATRGNTEGEGESIRNTEVRNYLDVIEHVVSMGGWVVRMGGPKAPPLPPMERVIDYAHTIFKSPEMDIHLVRHARMFIGTTSGFAYVASAFGIPSAIVDAISSIGLLWPKQTRFTTKLVRTRSGRMLSLAELTSNRFRWSLANYESLAKAGLTVEDNSPDEILAAAKEVLTLASDKDQSPADVLQPEWKAGFEIPDFFGGASPSRYFVEKHRNLLQ